MKCYLTFRSLNLLTVILFINIYLFSDNFQELQDCFESKDIKQLQDTMAALPEDEARYHLKRCVDSGLWVPDSRKNLGESENTTATKEPTEDDESEEIYDEPTH